MFHMNTFRANTLHTSIFHTSTFRANTLHTSIFHMNKKEDIITCFPDLYNEIKILNKLNEIIRYNEDSNIYMKLINEYNNFKINGNPRIMLCCLNIILKHNTYERNKISIIENFINDVVRNIVRNSSSSSNNNNSYRKEYEIENKDDDDDEDDNAGEDDNYDTDEEKDEDDNIDEDDNAGEDDNDDTNEEKDDEDDDNEEEEEKDEEEDDNKKNNKDSKKKLRTTIDNNKINNLVEHNKQIHKRKNNGKIICSEPGCNKCANYLYEMKWYCSIHGNMECSVRSCRYHCKSKGCINPPRYGPKEAAIHCELHKKSNERDMKRKICNKCNSTIVIRKKKTVMCKCISKKSKKIKRKCSIADCNKSPVHHDDKNWYCSIHRDKRTTVLRYKILCKYENCKNQA